MSTDEDRACTWHFTLSLQASQDPADAASRFRRIVDSDGPPGRRIDPQLLDRRRPGRGGHRGLHLRGANAALRGAQVADRPR
eukprot:CAMPEP_0172195036 /NCGR_PEP_ID=MMETSP1050-20130122/25958_1 /TAXON_ID=233186 /ORGANISM="Cryptomonas curvata, Strain CCAP979/52" /LENGTH=81 /DNA_ID=CAMNT_0012871001 /DNA_START=519 /DNA_END=760 /DNA_ORIENTATION=+